MVVLRSNDVCFLGIVRSLAAAGIRAIAVTFSWSGSGPWYSEASRHLDEVHRIANPFEEPQRAADEVAELGAALLERFGERLLVLGSSDTNLVFLRDNATRFARFFRFVGDPAMEEGPFELLHKATCAERLEAGGVSAPFTRHCRSADDVDRIVDEMIYPCVIKPAIKDYGQSFYARHDGDKALSVDGPGELRSRLGEELAAGFDLLVQEKIAFDSVHDEIPFYLYADAGHRIRLAATGVKEKIQPFPFGTATVLRLSYHPELLEHAREVVQALAFRGILMIEFIRDAKDGAWKVIELNPRPWLFVDFYRRFGLNYLGRLVDDRDGQLVAGEDLQTADDETLALPPMHVSLPPACGEYLESLGRAARVQDVRDWLRGIAGARSLTFLDPDDPAPGLAELGDFASRWQLDAGSLVSCVREESCGV